MKAQECGTTEYKTCTKCKEDKPETEFYLRRRSVKEEYKRQSQCKTCIKLRDKKKYSEDSSDKIKSANKYREANRDIINEKAAQYRAANRDKIAKTAKVYRKENREILAKRSSLWYANADKELISERMSTYRKSNPDKFKEYGLRRSHIVKQARVIWAKRHVVDDIYREARRLTKEKGTPYHVDHIVPLVHPKVCGLHCEQNLQVLTATENHTKFNKFYG